MEAGASISLGSAFSTQASPPSLTDRVTHSPIHPFTHSPIHLVTVFQALEFQLRLARKNHRREMTGAASFC